jgi:hypothetical protein
MRLGDGRDNKRMKLSKPGDSGGSWPRMSGIIESGFAAYAPCSTDLKGPP